jgi:hypothetical protein
MQEKTITIIIDAQGKSTLDLEGFAGQGCEKVFADFRGGDSVKRKSRDSPPLACPGRNHLRLSSLLSSSSVPSRKEHEHDSIYGKVYGWAAHRHVPLEIRGLTCLATLVIVSERRGAGCLTRGLSFRLGMVRGRRHSKGDSLSM